MGYFACRIAATAANRALLEALDHQGRICFDHHHEADGWLMLALTSSELEVVKQYDLDPEVTEDLEQTAAVRREERASTHDDDSDDAPATGFVDSYLDAGAVAARVAALAAEFPALCQLTTLPETTEGYDGSVAALAGPSAVQLLRLSDDPSDRGRPALLLICGTHAREWINPLIAIEFAEQLLRNHDPASADPQVLEITRILQQGEMLIVPVMNPDGLNFSFHDDAGWRKNRRANPGAPGCPGVDNNRNYEVFFGEAGSSPSACSNAHHGPFAFSEPENRNLKFIAENFPNILVAVDSHSQGEKIFRPIASGGSFTGSLPVSPEDELVYQQLEAAANAAIQAVSGKTYATGSTSNHAGTSDEYFFLAHRAFAFDFECALAFQPPIDSALVSVQEVVAALRALAIKAIDLDVAATTPARIVQAIDRTGSMAASGYDDDARANAKRLIDLMSIGDSVGVVSFADPSPDADATPLADRARVDLALTPLSTASLIQAHDEIDALTFAGWTSLGAGLQAAAGQLASGSTARDAIVLLSDGYENRAPWTGDVLDTLPAGLPVHTVALGGQSDIPLLLHVASETGGSFHLSPTSLELYEVYNQIRADASDDDLVFNGMVSAQQEDDGGDDASRAHAHHSHTDLYHLGFPDLNQAGAGFWVEPGVSRLLLSLASPSERRPGKFALIDPFGRRLRRGDWGYEAASRPGHLTLRVLRPAPGRWLVDLEGSGRCVLGAFVRSPLQVSCVPRLAWERKRCLAMLDVSVESRFAGSVELDGAAVLTPAAPWLPATDPASLEWLDAAGAQLRSHCRTGGGEHPPCGSGGRMAGYLEQSPVCVNPGKFPDGTPSRTIYRLRFTQPLAAGSYIARLRLSGRFAGHGRFERVLRTSVVIPPY
ncbi:M14 family zinc carboxypeptidase [Marilutibacter chinensis]|uniref:VWA domain-containing protein n=1 Tax=Marilutibacter chinensis TaxID=2912247 RepID=A0ABS9HTM7_9GAMM|nr:M14 family zinc carboxypeptidase [Lysobacter chinensis]MCF7221507.1 VWA domain-containing protein [Lysobacter chinensis]